MNDVTRILYAVEQGETGAPEQLLPLVYDELRKLAAVRMASEAPGQTLDATALVHEAYLRLVGSEGDRTFANRKHFFVAASEAMRRILVENARRKGRAKRGGRLRRVELDGDALETPQRDERLLAMDEALERLARIFHTRFARRYGAMALLLVGYGLSTSPSPPRARPPL